MNKNTRLHAMEKPRIWKVYEQEKVISVIHRFLPSTLRHVSYVQ